ncbi:hypothetical protein [Legionella lansingensis]|uniref:hypothetical protein n=1 Tax=Legionella lansingensis TaxID=45067 RepID=UPI000B27C675|nr:hypothetical protein [Legionella lansingensis]
MDTGLIGELLTLQVMVGGLVIGVVTVVFTLVVPLKLGMAMSADGKSADIGNVLKVSSK